MEIESPEYIRSVRTLSSILHASHCRGGELDSWNTQLHEVLAFVEARLVKFEGVEL